MLRSEMSLLFHVFYSSVEVSFRFVSPHSRTFNCIDNVTINLCIRLTLM